MKKFPYMLQIKKYTSLFLIVFLPIWISCTTDESLLLNGKERDSIGGSYIQLRDGITHYSLNNYKKDEPIIILIHGYSVPSFIWEPIVKYFNEANINNLTYDLFGHGYSDRPKTKYDRNLFAYQIEEMLDKLAPNRKLILVGWSMGAMIAARYATDHPDKVHSVYFFSPSGLPILKGFQGKLAILPIIGEIGMKIYGGIGLRSAQREFFYKNEFPNNYMEKFEKQLVYEGFRTAMLSTLREMDMDHFHNGYSDFAKTNLPVHVLWAINDKATPIGNSIVFQSLIPYANIQKISNVGHASFFEEPELAYNWLSKIIVSSIRSKN